MTTARSESLQVFVRVRPPISKEVKQDVAVSVPSSTNVSLNSEKGQTSCNYDHVFNELSEQNQVFDKVKPLLMDVLSGVNACIFAYGQTSAGKSFTMIGPNGGQDVFSRAREDWGILPRASEYLLGYLNDKSDEGELTFQVKASFLQIYNENLYDLLRDTGPAIEERLLLNEKEQQAELKIREIPKRRSKSAPAPTTNAGLHDVYISGLSEFRVQTSDDILRILQVGTRNRMTRSTDFNATSSRSHALLQLTFEIESHTPSGQTVINKSKLNLIDLAGSEKIPFATSDYNNPKHMKELSAINKSLSSLGNVIAALASKERSHIPYRDSKLTRILQDSLGGNTRTILIACVAPTAHYVSETMSTLQFADRAKNVMLTVKANTLVDDKFLLAKAHSEITRLKTLLAHALRQVEQLKTAANRGEGSAVGNMGLEGLNEKELVQLTEENAALKRENQQLRKLQDSSGNSHGDGISAAASGIAGKGGQLLDTRLLVQQNGRAKPLPRFGAELASLSPPPALAEKKKKRKKKLTHPQQELSPAAVFDLLDNDQHLVKPEYGTKGGSKQYKAINDRKIEELNSMLSRANHQMEQSQSQYQYMQQYLAQQQQQMQQYVVNQQTMQQQYVVGQSSQQRALLQQPAQQSYKYLPHQQQPQLLPHLKSTTEPVVVTSNASRPLPPQSPEQQPLYAYQPQVLPNLLPATNTSTAASINTNAASITTSSSLPKLTRSSPPVSSPEVEPLSSADSVAAAFPNSSIADSNRKSPRSNQQQQHTQQQQQPVAVPYQPPRNSILPSTAGSDVAMVVSSQAEVVPRNRITRKATHEQLTQQQLQKMDTANSADLEYADDDFDDVDESDTAVDNVDNTDEDEDDKQQQQHRQGGISMPTANRRSNQMNEETTAIRSSSHNNNSNSSPRRSFDSSMSHYKRNDQTAAKPAIRKSAEHAVHTIGIAPGAAASAIANALLPAATAEPLPLHKPAELTHSKEDIGSSVQLFSFRMNSWERIEIIDYESNKKLHKCRHVDGSAQWLDLKKKPVRALID